MNSKRIAATLHNQPKPKRKAKTIYFVSIKEEEARRNSPIPDDGIRTFCNDAHLVELESFERIVDTRAHRRDFDQEKYAEGVDKEG